MWAAHQMPIYQPPLKEVPTHPPATFNHLPPTPVHLYDLLADMPQSDILTTGCDFSSPNSESKARARARKQEKRERNNHTRRAAANLKAWIIQAEGILEMCPSVETYKDLDRMQVRVAKLQENLSSSNRRTASLDLLRDRLHRQLGSISALILDVQGKLGDRLEPIPCSISKFNGLCWNIY